MMTVVYSTDENYVTLTAVSMASLLKNNLGIHVVVLVNSVKAKSIAFLKSLCERLGGTFEAMDVADRLQKLKEGKVNGYVSYSAYARLFIPYLIAAPRVVYIDCDTLVVGDLSPLGQFDLAGKSFAIGYDCQRVEYKKMIDLDVSAPYFNSGVMVIDTATWKARQCTERLMSAVATSPKRAFFADQDLIARVLADEAAILSPEYNFLTHFQMFKTQKDVLRITGCSPNIWYDAEAYAKARRHPVIHHFLGHTLGRPWHRESRNPLRPLYKEYAALAGVPEVAEQSRPLDFGYRIQYLCWRLLPNFLFVQSCRAMYRYFFWSRYRV